MWVLSGPLTSRTIHDKLWELMRDYESPRRRHPHQALTTRAVQARHTPGRIADGNGLYLLVGPTGSKSWMLRTVVMGRRRDIGLGGVKLVSLAEAREEARRLRRIARNDGDPLVERRRKRVPKFEDAARLVHAAHAASFRNIKYRKDWLSSLNGVFAAFGAKHVDAIASGDVLTALAPQWLAKPETSRRVLQRVRTIFEWCKAQGYCAGDNPTQGITKVLPKHRGEQQHHAALPYQEVSGFLRTLQTADASASVRLAFEFTILTAARTIEVLRATWAEIDLEAKTWTIPGARMKGGREHRVPLAARAVKILQDAQALSDGGPYSFPGRSPKQPLSNMVFLMLVRRLGRSDFTPHGFRSTFRDWASERTSFPHAVCEAALAHTLRDKTEAAYHRTDLFDRRRDLMAFWAKFATSKPADVVAIAGRHFPR